MPVFNHAGQVDGDKMSGGALSRIRCNLLCVVHCDRDNAEQIAADPGEGREDVAAVAYMEVAGTALQIKAHSAQVAERNTKAWFEHTHALLQLPVARLPL
eukprot:1161717-Pelagomonas_calceolata.AAC.10